MCEHLPYVWGVTIPHITLLCVETSLDRCWVLVPCLYTVSSRRVTVLHATLAFVEHLNVVKTEQFPVLLCNYASRSLRNFLTLSYLVSLEFSYLKDVYFPPLNIKACFSLGVRLFPSTPSFCWIRIC